MVGWLVGWLGLLSLVADQNLGFGLIGWFVGWLVGSCIFGGGPEGWYSPSAAAWLKAPPIRNPQISTGPPPHPPHDTTFTKPYSHNFLLGIGGDAAPEDVACFSRT